MSKQQRRFNSNGHCVKSKAKPPQLYHNNRFMAATVSAGLAPGKSINDGIEAMERLKLKYLMTPLQLI
jgi:multidrug efflux pump subunit AcrB